MKEAHYGAVTPDVQEIMAKIYARDLIASNNRTFALSAVNDMDRQYSLRKEDKSNERIIPISFMSLMVIGFNLFSIIGVTLIFTIFPNSVEGLILALPVGIASAFSIVMDALVGWEYISDKFKVRFK